MKQRILVTGATGLIGRSLVERLRTDNELLALGRSAPGPGAQWLRADLSERLAVGTLPSRADAVVYLAQSEHFRDFPARAAHIFQVNVAAVQAMLDWARGAGVRRFVLASSGGVYGHGDNAFREDDAIAPGGPLGYYLASKQCAELLTESYAGSFTVVILRFFFVYGHGQRRSMLVPRLVDSVRQGRPVTLQGSEGVRLNPTYVEDASVAVCRALQLDESHVINVAGSEVFSLRELATAIGSAVGRDPVFDVRSQEAPRHLVADTQKMSRLLGAPKVRFADGLRALLAAEHER